MRNRRHILDQNYIESCGLQGTQGRLSTGTRTLDIDFNILHPVLHGLFGCIFGCKLGCKGRAFSGTLKTLHPCTGPRNHVACGVGNSNDSVIERRLNMGYPVQDVFLFFLFSRRSCHDRCCLLPISFSFLQQSAAVPCGSWRWCWSAALAPAVIFCAEAHDSIPVP